MSINLACLMLAPVVSEVSEVSEVSKVSEVSIVLLSVREAYRGDCGETVGVGKVVWCWWAGRVDVMMKHQVAVEVWLGHLGQVCPMGDAVGVSCGLAWDGWDIWDM